MWILRHAFAILVLPVTVAILVPRWLCRRSSVAFHFPVGVFDWVCAVAAVPLFLAGLALFVGSLFLFATEGRGTLAPWDPPRHLVLRGPYSFVRNPMISGVLLVITAESLFLRSPVHAAWVGVFLLINLIYIPLIEEPQLERRFGEDYRRYKGNVPRLLPRFSAFRTDT